MKIITIGLPDSAKRTLLSVLLILSGIPGLMAQRRVPVTMPQGGGGIFPDWLFMVIIVIISLIIILKFFGWFISCFRSLKAFSELLLLVCGTGVAWLLWQYTPWALGWCLLIAYAAIVSVFGAISFHKQFTRRN